jgi:hypothetical protein
VAFVVALYSEGVLSLLGAKGKRWCMLTNTETLQRLCAIKSSARSIDMLLGVAFVVAAYQRQRHTMATHTQTPLVFLKPHHRYQAQVKLGSSKLLLFSNKNELHDRQDTTKTRSIFNIIYCIKEMLHQNLGTATSHWNFVRSPNPQLATSFNPLLLVSFPFIVRYI